MLYILNGIEGYNICRKGRAYMVQTSGGPFTQAFRGALAQSGKTLVEVVDALAERGVKLTQATLSYWQYLDVLCRAASHPLLS